MPTGGPTWLVMLRDVSHAVRVRGEPHISLGLVLDADTGVILASSAASTDGEALRGALTRALSQPAGPVAPGPPDQVLCSPRIAAEVRRQLSRVRGIPAPSMVIEVDPVDEAEDIFDSLVGHMAGRHQSLDFATPADWRLLVDQARRYFEAEPWERWSDDADLALETRVGGRSASYVAVVLGNAGIERGLVLYPGTSVPIGLRESEPGDDPSPRPAR